MAFMNLATADQDTSVYKAFPFNLNPYWFSCFIYFFLSLEGNLIIFFFPIHLAGLKLESKPDYYEQILLSVAQLAGSHYDGIPKDPLAGTVGLISGQLKRVYLFFLMHFNLMLKEGRDIYLYEL